MTEQELRTININSELHAQLRVEAAKRRVKIKELVEAALRRYLVKGEKNDGSD